MSKEQSIELVKEQASKMSIMLDEFQVTDDESLAKVSDKIKQVKSLGKMIEAEKKKITDPAKQIIKQAGDTYDPYLKQTKNAEIVLKQRASKYMQERDEKTRKEEERIAERVERGTMKPETAMKKLEAMPTAEKTIRTDQGSGLRMSKKRVAIIENPEIIPKEYWIIDEKLVKKDALEKDKNGEAQIPGVVIKEEQVMSSV